MSAGFEEIDRRPTPMGEISLRRRLEPTLLIDVYEVKLGDEFLMSNLFTVAEVALADLGLARVAGTDLDIVVGGLGLGYTARAALEDPRVRSMYVVEALDEVIGWHRDHLLPLADPLTSDPRCHLVQGDFFSMVAGGSGFGTDLPALCHAILVDIEQRNDIFRVELILHSDIKEGVQRICAAFPRNLDHRLPFQRFERGIVHISHFHQVPVAGKDARVG